MRHADMFRSRRLRRPHLSRKKKALSGASPEQPKSASLAFSRTRSLSLEQIARADAPQLHYLHVAWAMADRKRNLPPQAIAVLKQWLTNLDTANEEQ